MVSEEKWKMVNSHVLEASKSKPSWRMCTVEMIDLRAYTPKIYKSAYVSAADEKT